MAERTSSPAAAVAPPDRVREVVADLADHRSWVAPVRGAEVPAQGPERRTVPGAAPTASARRAHRG